MPVVTLRLMEVERKTARIIGGNSLPMDVSVHVPHAAKDREQNSQGRSPGSWLQTQRILSSHPR